MTMLFENQEITAGLYKETEINLDAGDYIEAEIDTSALTSWAHNVLLIVAPDVSMNGSADNPNMEVRYNPTEYFGALYNHANYSDCKITEVPQTLLTVRIDLNGVTINGNPLYPSSCAYPVNAQPALDAIRSLSKVQVGVKTGVNATWNYVKVVRV